MRPGYRVAGPRSDTFNVFQYTLGGRGEFVYGGEVHAVPAGSGFLCQVADPGVTYGYPSDADEPYEFIFITFFGAREMVDGLLTKNGPIFAIQDIRALTQWSRMGGELVQIQASESAQIVTQLLLKLARSTRPTTASTHAHLLSQARRLAQQSRSRLTVRELASELCVSREHLARVFKAELGTSPRAWLEQLKMRRASEVLQETTQSIKEVGDELGYDTASHFARAFRRVTGQSPREFRESGSRFL